MEDLYKLKKTLLSQLEDYGAKGQVRNGTDLNAIDTLAHACKNLCKIIESEDGGGYSQEGYSREGNSYGDGMYSNRGRGRYAKRDSMGRYSRSSHDTMEKLRDLMDDTQDEGIRREIRKIIEHMETM